jgi:hypothetical protein
MQAAGASGCGEAPQLSREEARGRDSGIRKRASRTTTKMRYWGLRRAETGNYEVANWSRLAGLPVSRFLNPES